MAKRKARVAETDSDSDSDQAGNQRTKVPRASPSGAAEQNAQQRPFRNKEKVLVLPSRGITFRYRHLMLDLMQLIPHCKKDVKLDTKGNRALINEVADMKGCSSVLYFEARKKKDLYMWVAKAPNGPSFKFHVANVHTMAELKLSGNHLKGSRAVLSFDKSFDKEPHWQLLKEVLTQVFATPKGHFKSKPFFDHVISFHIADGRVWMRNYQAVIPQEKKKAIVEDASLVEVGPRCCFNPIVALAGSFGGRVLYENPAYVSPNAIRATLKARHGTKYASKVAGKEKRKQHLADNPAPRNPLADVFKE